MNIACVYMPGMSVMAVWSDKHYYPATVLSLDNKKRVEVKFVEDESVSWLKAAGVVCCELVPVGLNVLAKRVETNWSEPAMVVSHYTDNTADGPSTGYNVQFNSSDSITRYRLSAMFFNFRYQVSKCLCLNNDW